MQDLQRKENDKSQENCSRCGKVFLGSNSLKLHQETSKDCDCFKCGMKFCRRKDLLLHMGSDHAVTKPKGPISKDEQESAKIKPSNEVVEIIDFTGLVQKVAIEKGGSKYRLSAKPKSKVQINDFFISVDENKKILLREYVPKNISTNKVILYFHGGGYVLNSVDIYDDAVSFFSDCLKARIFSLDYSLSPEHKFPYAVEEVKDVLNSLINFEKDFLAIAHI